jgi:L-amino acid N-acyltransferase YncA
MKFDIAPMGKDDRVPVIDLFNYYIANSFAAYPETIVPYPAFDMFLQMTEGYPTATVRDESGSVIGFGFLRAHNPLPVFSETAEITYFIDREYTGRGIGRTLLDYFEAEAKKKGVRNILASISSLNPGSVNFHLKNGFAECGCFKNAGKKNGLLFDIVWMQKAI